MNDFKYTLKFVSFQKLQTDFKPTNLFYALGFVRLAVAQLVEALCYNSEGRGFDSRWRHWNFSFI